MIATKLPLLLIVAVWMAGHGAPGTGAPVDPESSAPAVAARQTASLESALLGHWKAGSTHLYFSPGRLVRIEAGSKPVVLQYSIEASDEASGVLLTRMSVRTGWHWNEMTFSPDRRQFSPKVWAEGDYFKMQSRAAQYVNGDQQPGAVSD